MSDDAIRVSGRSYEDLLSMNYDRWFGAAAPTDDCVRLLASLVADGGSVVELGIGTGRVALPLARSGVDVRGVEASKAMVERLREKAGDDVVPVSFGDFVDGPDEGGHALVYLVGGTLFELQSQEEQVRCLRNAALRLRPGGLFVFDAPLPEALESPRMSGGHVVPTGNEDLVVLYRRVHRSTQRYESHYVVTTGEGVHHVHVPFRYAGAGELDLMAEAAGLHLRDRYGDWSGRPLADDSLYHVSVYQKTP
ncbi:class I SAM-dependent methyltransferase [Nocardiopsis ansamitocini]|uniref:Methyltransferase n=1 Tax=Nocardiopsis ansamitocini TaxID=1670832 RepID=A0A9W6P6D8_9ACTN|nr:class I SAM-dependent methyltransferase [Nocardiopsis ansamitocini]GLU47872.1 methyltransferase [Nocardiopsis ansamitocini]